MDLKKLGSSGVAFLLMLNSASVPATFAVADENVEIVSEEQEEQYTVETSEAVSAPTAVEPPKPTEAPAAAKPVEATPARRRQSLLKPRKLRQLKKP